MYWYVDALTCSGWISWCTIHIAWSSVSDNRQTRDVSQRRVLKVVILNYDCNDEPNDLESTFLSISSLVLTLCTYPRIQACPAQHTQIKYIPTADGEKVSRVSTHACSHSLPTYLT